MACPPRLRTSSRHGPQAPVLSSCRPCRYRVQPHQLCADSRTRRLSDVALPDRSSKPQDIHPPTLAKSDPGTARRRVDPSSMLSPLTNFSLTFLTNLPPAHLVRRDVPVPTLSHGFTLMPRRAHNKGIPAQKPRPRTRLATIHINYPDLMPRCHCQIT
ncbi:hypothetical protein BGZ61DRAFT_159459 [Ilyonectria robusta]|uniref:uncharacterized protein n=1 Tax=Ilyonectria robusta TaxID=1079257 RepID=UPI001E8D8879|nr:uncharacterized protein BGZ61DRAFT_159459 [Ilyonectria robusta]KAH8733421.1 hypothetical protein BGZ61DRAFT_159459 [Ilyonectria robusta]